MTATFLIVFREALEALLVIGAILAFLPHDSVFKLFSRPCC